MTVTLGCPYNESGPCSTWVSVQYVIRVVNSCEVFGRRREIIKDMSLLEEDLLLTIQHSFDIIHVCYFSENSSCCDTEEVLSKLGTNMTRMADKLGIIGQITAIFFKEFDLITSYVGILSEWPVVSRYPYELCPKTTITTTATSTTTISSTTTTTTVVSRYPYELFPRTTIATSTIVSTTYKQDGVIFINHLKKQNKKTYGTYSCWLLKKKQNKRTPHIEFQHLLNSFIFSHLFPYYWSK